MSENTRQLARDARRALRRGQAAIAERRRTRLAEIVTYARVNSPYYGELYRDLPAKVEDPAMLPVTNKKALVARFDDWVTDRAVTQEKVEAFVADPTLVGKRFQDRYLVATTSGTSGVRGLFLMDERNNAVHAGLGSRARGVFGPRELVRMIARGGRTAVVSAPRGHFFTVAGTERFRQDNPLLARIMRVFSMHQPLPELVAELNRYNPASLAGFLSVLTQLAGEQEAGRLRISPALVIPGGETATADALERIARAFHAKVRPAYACTECGYLSFSCPHGWYHVNSDWAVVEPVDADHRPVPPGQPSHTVLISNLANRVQPIVRYDLGDSVLLRPDPCPCGSPLPATGCRAARPMCSPSPPIAASKSASRRCCSAPSWTAYPTSSSSRSSRPRPPRCAFACSRRTGPTPPACGRPCAARSIACSPRTRSSTSRSSAPMNRRSGEQAASTAGSSRCAPRRREGRGLPVHPRAQPVLAVVVGV
jgi:phenylacetate-coenzyme A ligase PaaK-like adenylate-forming protein